MAGAAHAADQTLVGVTSVRFAWTAASGQPTGYLVSRSLNRGAYQSYATTTAPEISIPVTPGTQISIRVAATGYNSSGAYVIGPQSADSYLITVLAAPVFPVEGSWLLRCASCSTMMTRSLSNASLVLAQAPALASPWRVLGQAKLQHGRNQIIWHNSSTGQLSIYDGQFLAPIAGLTAYGPAALRGVGAIDFDSDGSEEFVAQRTDTGAVLVFAIDAGRFGQVATLPRPPGARLVAVADFDHDGRADLLWSDPLARTIDLWLLAADPTLSIPLTSLVTRWVRVASGLAVDTSVASTGDYNGDRYLDLLWRSSDGRLAISYLFAGVTLGYVPLVPVPGDVNRRVMGSVDVGGTVGDEIGLQDVATGVISILDPSPSGANSRTTVIHTGVEWSVIGIDS